MQKLTWKEASDIALRYQFLKNFTVGGFKIHDVTKWPYDENKDDKESQKVIVIIATQGTHSRIEDLEDFCVNHNLPYPVLAL